MTPGCDRNIGAPDMRQDTAADFAISEDEFVLPMLPPGGSIDNIITHIGG